MAIDNANPLLKLLAERLRAAHAKMRREDTMLCVLKAAYTSDDGLLEGHVKGMCELIEETNNEASEIVESVANKLERAASA